MLQLKKFPDIPVSTREEVRVSCPHPEEAHLRLLAREKGSFPCVFGKKFSEFPSQPRGGALHRKGERNSRVVPPFPETPRCLSPFQGNLFSLHCVDFHVEERLTLRWHLVQTCGKPRGKASRDSHRSLNPREGKRGSAASAWEESARACPHSRRRKTPLVRLQK